MQWQAVRMEDDFIPNPQRVVMSQAQAAMIVGHMFDRKLSLSRQCGRAWDDDAEETAARHVRRRDGAKKKRGSDFTIGRRKV